MIVCFLATLLLGQAQQGLSYSDTVSDAFLSLLQQAAYHVEDTSIGTNDNIISKINDLQQPSRYQQHKSTELDHQLSGPRPKVQIKNGLITGETISESHAFYSIPYGKAPVGSLRFMPPEPAEDFTELNASLPNYRMCWQIKDCDEDEPNCRDPMSEDCLVLNVNVPSYVSLYDSSTPPSDRLPVLVWFHGGFFFRGRATTTKYDGRWLSPAINAVVVTVNYRVGPLGFLSFEDDLGFVPGNQGLQDQQLALQWVQDNIEKFGGDKTRVTIFGNSAGSQSISFHLTSSVSDPLFHRAILQSAPLAIQHQTPFESMTSVTEKVLDYIGCPGNFSCLRNVDAEIITYSRNAVIAKLLGERDLFGVFEPFRPVIDGLEFKDQPLARFKDGLWQTHKEVMIGFNEHEMAFVNAFFEDIGLPLPKALFEKVNTLMFGTTNGEKLISMYDEERLDFDFSDNLAQEITDLVFVCPNRALARYAAQTSTHAQKRVYFYNNAYPLSLENCMKIEEMHTLCAYSYHSAEQIFVFKSAQGYETDFNSDDQLISDMFSAYWGGFAATGDPSFKVSNFTAWPVYEENSSPPMINIRIQHPNSLEQDDYRGKHCDLWEEIGYKALFNSLHVYR